VKAATRYFWAKIVTTWVITLTALLYSSTVSFATPTSIDNIRIHNFKSKTRVVLDFSSKVENYYIKASKPNETTLVIGNTVVKDSLSKQVDLNTVKKVLLYTRDSDTAMVLNIPLKNIDVFTLSDPFRIVLDLNGVQNHKANKTEHNSNNDEIHPGINYKKYYLKGPVVVNVIDIDLNDPFLDLQPVLASPNSVLAKTSVSRMIGKYDAIAGINASFFKPPTGLPLGALIINEEYITGPIYNRVALVIDKNNRAYLDKIKLNACFSLADGKSFKIHNINQPRLSLEGFMLYSDKWNSLVPKTLKNELQIAVVDGRVIQKSTGSLRVPQNGYVITGPNKDDFKGIQLYDSIHINMNTFSIVPNIKHAIGAGPYLLKNGRVYIDSKEEKFSFSSYTRDPRSAVGITRDNHLLMVTVDGRQRGSVGMSFYQLAHFMKNLGAVEAMNLDGGSSTQMSVKGRIVNNPTVRGGAAVSTGIVVKESSSFSVAKKPE
jgi:exopolysaccharide biosynthesis protein